MYVWGPIDAPKPVQIIRTPRVVTAHQASDGLPACTGGASFGLFGMSSPCRFQAPSAGSGGGGWGWLGAVGHWVTRTAVPFAVHHRREGLEIAAWAFAPSHRQGHD
jgi:hypothetical protein